LIAILLTRGEAHDCPVAGRLINRVQTAERMLGDKAASPLARYGAMWERARSRLATPQLAAND
jgi:hypothetical protein